MNLNLAHDKQKKIAQGAVLTSLAISLLVLIGWHFDIAILKTLVPHYVSMKVNTALGIGLLGGAAGLIVFSEQLTNTRRNLMLALLGCVALLAGATLAEYIFNCNLHIDQMLYMDADAGRFWPPGRMAPVSGIIFLTMSFATFAAYGLQKPLYRAAQLSYLISALLPFQALVSYFLGIQTSFGVALHTRIALHTAIGMILLCGAFMSGISKQGFMKVFTADSPGGETARRLFIAALFVPPSVHALQLVAERAGWIDRDFGTLFKTMCSVMFFVLMVWKNSERLHVSEETRRREEREKLDLLARGSITKAVEQSENRLRAIFDSAFDAIVGINNAGVITEWNPQAEKIFGYKRSEALGMNMAQALQVSDSESSEGLAARGLLSITAETSLNRSIETRAKRRSGESFAIQISISPIQTGTDRFYIAYIADISQRKKSEAELIGARQKALDAATAKAEFLANMSHEIRTPMNGIIGMTDLLLGTVLDTEQTKFTKIVQESSHVLLTIINDILDFSKVEAGKLALELTDFEVQPLIESQLALLTPKAKEKGIELSTLFVSGLPTRMHADSGRIAQVLLNLIGNAIKFTPKGSIEVRAEFTAGFIRFSVTDTGIGLDEKVIARLFQPFAQADGSTARKYGGTGLGLSISKKLAELLGGQIGVESKVGYGSKFWFSVPYVVPKVSDAKNVLQLASAPEVHSTISETNRLARILVVEDNPVNQLLALTYLRSKGLIAQAVANGREAVEITERNVYDLILMDCQMPEMDGFEATRAIRKREAKTGGRVPIIALTANAMKSDEEKCLASGMDGFLTKPIKVDQLIAIVNSHLSAREKTAG